MGWSGMRALCSSPWMLDRANVLVGLVVGIAPGARNLRLAELLARHSSGLVGDGASDSTLWRMLRDIDDRTRRRIAVARAAVRVSVWDLLAAREDGFPWLVILGRELTCACRKWRPRRSRCLLILADYTAGPVVLSGAEGVEIGDFGR